MLTDCVMMPPLAPPMSMLWIRVLSADHVRLKNAHICKPPAFSNSPTLKLGARGGAHICQSHRSMSEGHCREVCSWLRVSVIAPCCLRPIIFRTVEAGAQNPKRKRAQNHTPRRTHNRKCIIARELPAGSPAGGLPAGSPAGGLPVESPAGTSRGTSRGNFPEVPRGIPAGFPAGTSCGNLPREVPREDVLREVPR